MRQRTLRVGGGGGRSRELPCVSGREGKTLKMVVFYLAKYFNDNNNLFRPLDSIHV